MAYGDPHCLTIELQLSYRNVKSSIITDYVILLELFSFCQFYMDKQSDLHCACRTIQFLFLAFCKVVASPPSATVAVWSRKLRKCSAVQKAFKQPHCNSLAISAQYCTHYYSSHHILQSITLWTVIHIHNRHRLEHISRAVCFSIELVVNNCRNYYNYCRCALSWLRDRLVHPITVWHTTFGETEAHTYCPRSCCCNNKN